MSSRKLNLILLALLIISIESLRLSHIERGDAAQDKVEIKKEEAAIKDSFEDTAGRAPKGSKDAKEDSTSVIKERALLKDTK